ncbi:recombination-associated protein RdgC [Cysteiniphilum marinum]|uniref:recombination-associated protein RdgC n=1 Tax=Cysteiniphilum marinum TaxID=2774191 RepID=UPI00193A4F91|nr:recombination-associated protein RdgC [Cysteiniphilum marinum]
MTPTSLSPFTLNTQVTTSDLNNALTTHAFQQCTSVTPSTHGFIAPFAHSEDLAYELNNCVLPLGEAKEELAKLGLSLTTTELRAIAFKELGFSSVATALYVGCSCGTIRTHLRNVSVKYQDSFNYGSISDLFNEKIIDCLSQYLKNFFTEIDFKTILMKEKTITKKKAA